MFSTKRTCPSSRALIAASNSAPRVHLGKLNFLTQVLQPSQQLQEQVIYQLYQLLLSTSKVREKNCTSTLFEDVLNSWKSCCDTVVVSDHAIFQWYVEVNTNENFLPFKSTSLTVSFAMLQNPLIILFETIISHLWKYKERFHKIFRYLIFIFFFCFNVKAKLARPRLANPAIRASLASAVPVFGNCLLASSDLIAVFSLFFLCRRYCWFSFYFCSNFNNFWNRLLDDFC